MIQITLDQIKTHNPCPGGLQTLAAAFPDQEIFDFEAVAKTLHFNYVLWGLRVLPLDQCKQIAVPFAQFCAEQAASAANDAAKYTSAANDTAAWVVAWVASAAEDAWIANAAATNAANAAAWVASAAEDAWIAKQIANYVDEAARYAVYTRSAASAAYDGNVAYDEDAEMAADDARDEQRAELIRLIKTIENGG